MNKLLDNIFTGTPERAWFWSTTFPFFLLAILFKRRTCYITLAGSVYDGLTTEDLNRMRSEWEERNSR